MLQIIASTNRVETEKNPGPPISVDPNKTMAAPYSQGNELVFGQNCSYKFSFEKVELIRFADVCSEMNI